MRQPLQVSGAECVWWACCDLMPPQSSKKPDGTSCLRGSARWWQDVPCWCMLNAFWEEWGLNMGHVLIHLRAFVLSVIYVAEQLTEGASALLELAKKSNATSPVEAQPQQPQKSVYLVGWWLWAGTCTSTRALDGLL